MTTQNAKTEWSLTGGGHLQESNPGGRLPRRGPGTSTLWKIIYCIQCLSYDVCSSMLSRSFLYILSSIMHTAKIEISEGIKWSLTIVKNNGKWLTIKPKKWSQSLTGGGHLLEVPTVRLWLGKCWCFGLVITYERWSYMEVWLYFDVTVLGQCRGFKKLATFSPEEEATSLNNVMDKNIICSCRNVCNLV